MAVSILLPGQDWMVDDLSCKESKANLLKFIGRLRDLIVKDRITSLAIIGHDNMTGLILSEHCINMERPEGLFAIAGALNCLSAEVQMQAEVSPCLSIDGQVVNPNDFNFGVTKTPREDYEDV